MPSHLTIGGARIYDLDYIGRRFLQRLIEQAEESGESARLERAMVACGVGSEAVLAREIGFDLSQYYFLLSILSPEVEDPLFFLKLGRRYDILDLGMLGLAMLYARNLRHSLDISLSGSTRNLWHPLAVRRSVAGGKVSLRLSEGGLTAVQRRCFHEEWLSATWRWLVQRHHDLARAQEMEVALPYPRPDHAPHYAEFFPGTIRFGAPAGALVIPRSYYERAFDRATRIPDHLYSREWYRLLGVGFDSDPVLRELQIYLARKLGDQASGVEEAAAHLGLSKHGLQRHLRKSGSTYREIKLSLHMALARRFLAETTIPIKEISYLLGYGHAPTFHRAFLGSHGVTPAKFRSGHDVTGSRRRDSAGAGAGPRGASKAVAETMAPFPAAG